jgi:hypothetical protein
VGVEHGEGRLVSRGYVKSTEQPASLKFEGTEVELSVAGCAIHKSRYINLQARIHAGRKRKKEREPVAILSSSTH